MDKLSNAIVQQIINKGADLVGIGCITELQSEVRHDLPFGISIAVKYPKEIICGITEYPTQEYKNWYDALNERLDSLATFGADLLIHSGYQAIAQTRKFVGNAEEKLQSPLPHKTIATRAGLGWIGKCALLVTEQYGSMVRLSSILTDAPLIPVVPINESKCGSCLICTRACPAGAVTGRAWNVTLHRDDFYNPVKCRDMAKERSKIGIGKEITLCGKCIVVCPYTKKYLKN